MSQGICTVGDCGKTEQLRRGMCNQHYLKWWYAQPPSCSRSRCADDGGCDGIATRRGLCEKHYRRLMRAERGEQIRATRAAWRERNREHVRAVYADWEKRNPGKVSLRDRRNKGRRRATVGVPDPLNYEQILVKHGMTCHICLGEIGSAADLHFDHVIPLARGGRHAYGNVLPSHRSCNLRKGTRLMAELSGRG